MILNNPMVINKKNHREATGADKAAGDKFVISLARIIKGEYLPQQIYNYDIKQGQLGKKCSTISLSQKKKNILRA